MLKAPDRQDLAEVLLGCWCFRGIRRSPIGVSHVPGHLTFTQMLEGMSSSARDSHMRSTASSLVLYAGGTVVSRNGPTDATDRMLPTPTPLRLHQRHQGAGAKEGAQGTPIHCIAPHIQRCALQAFHGVDAGVAHKNVHATKRAPACRRRSGPLFLTRHGQRRRRGCLAHPPATLQRRRRHWPRIPRSRAQAASPR